MYGFHGRLLYINLSTGQSSWRELEQARLRYVQAFLAIGGGFVRTADVIRTELFDFLRIPSVSAKMKEE